MAIKERAKAGLRATDEDPSARQWKASRSGMARMVLVCAVCDKREGAKVCQRCKVSAYCGKEHQKADWKAHKKICASLANGNAAS